MKLLCPGGTSVITEPLLLSLALVHLLTAVRFSARISPVTGSGARAPELKLMKPVHCVTVHVFRASQAVNNASDTDIMSMP